MPSRRPLPWCKGPKLRHFDFGVSSPESVQFLYKIGSGLHAEVYRAQINNEQFAVKVFKFWRAKEISPQGDLEGGWVTVDDVLNHVDPFHCECRAYGRLIDTDKEHLAIKCYGYILISPEQETELDPSGNLFRRDRWNRGRPLRAIVKQLLPSKTISFTRQMIPRMKQDIKTLNKLGIVVYDLREENYMDGLLIDFSQAHTNPHHLLDLTNPSNTLDMVKRLCARDWISFDAMVDLWNQRNPTLAVWHCFFLPNPAFTSRLRRQPMMPYYKQYNIPLDAALYGSTSVAKKLKRNSLSLVSPAEERDGKGTE